MDVVDESRADGTYPESERDGGDEPAGTDVFAGHVGGDLEDDVGDVEDGEEFVVIVTFEPEVFF